MRKVTIIGGGGIRTPLLIHGLVQAQSTLGVREVALYDIDRDRVKLIAALGHEIIRRTGADLSITIPAGLEEGVEGAHFILHSVRVGGIGARARDERLAIEHGATGQETTGLGGLAMALRTVPIALEHARTIEKIAPEAWVISFTNPAGLITQALTTHSNLRVIGVCDTPSEMFHRVAQALHEPLADVNCEYFGLNHLGWIRRVLVRGEDVTARLINDHAALRSLYHADLFDSEMVRELELIPSEYLFFYYERQRALANQRAAGASRGEEIAQLNLALNSALARAGEEGDWAEALEIYRNYLRRRSGSYMRLEAEAGSALKPGVEQEEDPFDAATGYHRIALDVMAALVSSSPARIVLNAPNCGAIADLAPDDVVEVPCLVNQQLIQPQTVGRLPQATRGLVQAVKQYERLAICAAIEKRQSLARRALLVNPLVGQWEQARRLIEALIESDQENLGYITNPT